jgi:hypothetical protein
MSSQQQQQQQLQEEEETARAMDGIQWDDDSVSSSDIVYCRDCSYGVVCGSAADLWSCLPFVARGGSGLM